MKPLKFAGVDGVRIVEKKGMFFVQSQWAEVDGEPVRSEWHTVGEPFMTLIEAVDEAPFLCEF